jgi:two-component system, OmpR family, response regulator MprA
MRSVVQLLVADDDDGLRESLRLTLEAWGYRVAAAESGAQALEVARSLAIDCSILDYRMRDMTGLEVFRQLQALRPGSPSILMSAELERALRAQAADLGIARCLAKPIPLGVLRTTVAEVLRQSFRSPS